MDLESLKHLLAKIHEQSKTGDMMLTSKTRVTEREWVHGRLVKAH